MKGSWLTSYWIVSPNPRAPLGFGVTGFSLEEALRIIRSEGYEDCLPDDLGQLQVIENVAIQDLDQRHVVPNMGPMVMRGLWYPCQNLGWPRSY
jgi:hypothetical protein